MPSPIATRLSTFPLVLGGNVFGWTADRELSEHILDGFQAAGGLMIDTADSYSAWVPGNAGGESERIIGAWMDEADLRDEVLIATKVSQHPDFRGLAPENVRRAVEASLERLRTDVIDVYFAHFDDEATPLTETARVFHELVDEGVVREIGVSNYTPDRIATWLSICDAEGYTRPTLVQPPYNLVAREIEHTVIPLAVAEDLAVVPYYGLASGFLTGKYRDGAEAVSPRAQGAQRYATEQGIAIVDAVAEIAAERGVEPATVALAWLNAKPGVTAPIASVSHPDQLKDLLAVPRTRLTADEVARLDAVSADARF